MKNRFLFYGRFLFAVILTFAFSVSVEAATSPCPFTWTNNIRVGSEGEDVLKLQQFLNSYPDTVIALSGAGSVGNKSTSYGPRTAKAVVKCQEKYAADTLAPVGLTKGSGFVGVLTRAKLNRLCVSQAILSVMETNVAVPKIPDAVNFGTPAVTFSPVPENTNSAVVEDVLTVSAPEQPAPTLAPAGAGWVPFTNIALTAGNRDVTVKSITVERIGFGADGAFDTIALIDEESNQIGEERGFRSDHKVELGEPFSVLSGTSKTVTIVANMVSDLSSFGGQMPTLQVVTVNPSTRVTGTLPVRGTAHSINSTLVIGGATVTLSSFDPAVALTRYINDRAVRFSGIRLTANSKEDLTLSSIIWDQTGSAGNADVANVMTVVDGTSYPTTVSKRTFTSNFSPPVSIRKGYSIDVYVQGDLLPSAVNRTVKFDIRKSGNIAILGNSYSYYVLILPDGNTAVSGNSVFLTSDGTTSGSERRPFFSGSIVTVGGGTFTSIGK